MIWLVKWALRLISPFRWWDIYRYGYGRVRSGEREHDHMMAKERRERRGHFG